MPKYVNWTSWAQLLGWAWMNILAGNILKTNVAKLYDIKQLLLWKVVDTYCGNLLLRHAHIENKVLQVNNSTFMSINNSFEAQT